MSSGITFSGLATGLDTASIIEQLVGLERAPIRRLEQRQRTYDTQASKLRSMVSKLEALRTAAEKLEDRDDVLTSSVSSSDENVFTASVVGAPSVGASSVHVTSLARSEKTLSNTFAARDQTGLFGTGTVSIQVGSGAAVDVTVEATDTLESLVGKINAADAGVTAGLVFDGTDWRLRVSGDETGAANAITFTETGTTLGLADPANELQAAADAVFTIDGLPMTRSTNVVSDAIPGVTLTLTGESPGTEPAALSVSRDPEALREKVQGFVDAYNAVMNQISAEFTATPGVERGPESLSGDSTLRGIQSRLRQLVGSEVAGTSGAYTTLASIGVETTRDGTLSLEASDLDAAIAADPSAVARLFAGDAVAGIDGFVASLGALVTEYVESGDGILTQRIDSLEGRKRDIDDQIDRLELRVDKTEENLRKQYAALEQIVSGYQSQGNQMLAALSSLTAG